MDIEKLQLKELQHFMLGIDIGASEGTKLVAVSSGTVTKASWGGSGGYTIIIDAGEYTLTYCHCDPKFLVKVGDKVKVGQVIRKSRTEECL